MILRPWYVFFLPTEVISTYSLQEAQIAKQYNLSKGGWKQYQVLESSNQDTMFFVQRGNLCEVGLKWEDPIKFF